MASEARERMVASAVVLLAKHGYQGTSFSDVLAASGAPRGSIYHHFPDGKDQLIGAAVELAGAHAVALLDSLRGMPPADVVDGFMVMWRSVLERSGFSAGCSVLAVTVSADSPELVAAAGTIFRAWRQRLADILVSAGWAEARAASFALMLIAASEGAVVVSRAQRDFEPFDTVWQQLRAEASRA